MEVRERLGPPREIPALALAQLRDGAQLLKQRLDPIEILASRVPHDVEDGGNAAPAQGMGGVPWLFDGSLSRTVLPSGRVATSRARIVRASPGLVWRAVDDDGAVGAVTAFLRPDDRWFVAFDACREDVVASLLAAVAANTGSDLWATVDDDDEYTLELLEMHGFAVARRESVLLIPTDPAITGLGPTAEPAGVVVVSAADAYEDELRRLDDALRQDVPGTAGWRWDPGDFHEETFDSQFDPATYLIAVDAASGEYMSLARVWNSPGRPRLGLIATLAPYRRRGLARMLLARAFLVLHGRGRPEVTAEVDETNTAARSLLLPLGAKRAGGCVELVRRHRD
jgi:GNAT superfamily N-acetyltransferase